jgi:hypothetical protein
MADTPSEEHGNLTSANHGGCGGNVLYEDGHVCYQKRSTLPESQSDPIYLNDNGKEAAGVGRDDVVLGRSEVSPGRVEALMP